MTHLWIRSEARPTEQRVPIIPEHAAQLVRDGFTVTIEKSPTRIIPIDHYEAVGCHVAPTGSWVDAPDDAIILGIKELPDEPAALKHTHIYFAHAYKGQEGADFTLERFRRGGGELLDVEYLTEHGRRVVAFGFWAGYVGAALSVLHARGALTGPVQPMSREELDSQLRETAAGHVPERALVIGSRGRSGKGANEALTTAGCEVTLWERGHTVILDKEALLLHEILVNCVVSHIPRTPWVAHEDVERQRNLRVIGDVTCDVTSDCNLLPINTAITTWDEPVRACGTPEQPLDVIAIDNLPSLLPLEASHSFSTELMPLLPDLAERRGPWAESLAHFRQFVS